LDWRILGYSSYWSFAANHLEYDKRIPDKIVRCLNVDYLVKKIAPYTYQVKKSECLDLPPKTYETEYYFLAESQSVEYDYVKEMFLGDVDEFKPETIYRLLTALQLVLSGRKVISKLKEPIRSASMFENPINNPRIECLLGLLNQDEKTIIFCKFSDEIETIARILNDKYGDGAAVPFYGALSQKQRQKNLDLFLNNSNFLVANKVCAGYGLNLQFCSYVIYYSNDYDFATRSQSEDRVHRIGQAKNVHIIDICAANKLDERILICLWRKENLADNFKGKINAVKDKVALGRWLDGFENNLGAKLVRKASRNTKVC
jgi:SNF2 family DNA or RNA helicase